MLSDGSLGDYTGFTRAAHFAAEVRRGVLERADGAEPGAHFAEGGGWGVGSGGGGGCLRGGVVGVWREGEW